MRREKAVAGAHSRKGDRMDKMRVMAAGGAAIVLVGGVYLAVADNDAGGHTPAPRAASVRPAAGGAPPEPLTTAAAQPLPDPARSEDCLIEPSRLIHVNSGVEGVIAAILVDRGDTVGRGQVVARLRADVDRATADAAQARAANSHAVRAADARAAYLDSVRRRSEEIRVHLARDKVEEAEANAEAAAFAAAVDDFKAAGASVIGMSADGVEQLKPFSVQHWSSKFPVASATPAIMRGSAVASDRQDQGRSITSRTSYVIGRDGKIKYALTDSNPARHVANTLAAVRALGN